MCIVSSSSPGSVKYGTPAYWLQIVANLKQMIATVDKDGSIAAIFMKLVAIAIAPDLTVIVEARLASSKPYLEFLRQKINSDLVDKIVQWMGLQTANNASYSPQSATIKLQPSDDFIPSATTMESIYNAEDSYKNASSGTPKDGEEPAGAAAGTGRLIASYSAANSAERNSNWSPDSSMKLDGEQADAFFKQTSSKQPQDLYGPSSPVPPANPPTDPNSYIRDLTIFAQPAMEAMNTWLLAYLPNQPPNTPLNSLINTYCKRFSVPADVRDLMHGIRINANYMRHPHSSKPHPTPLPYGKVSLLVYQQYANSSLGSPSGTLAQPTAGLAAVGVATPKSMSTRRRFRAELVSAPFLALFPL